MARLALSVYLMVATVGGPWWLCCCAPARVADLFTARWTVQPVVQQQEQDTPKCSCCQHHKPAPAPTKEKAPSTPSAPCPCKESQPTPFLGSADDPMANAQLGKSSGSFQLAEMNSAFSDSFCTTLDQGALGAIPISPGGNCRDLLALHHILRC
jgi:hypothetical protein